MGYYKNYYIISATFYLLRDSSSPAKCFISSGCIALIVMNNVCTDESVAIERPLAELLRIRLTKISILLRRALRNSSSPLEASPFWYFYGTEES
jgi:hypothetical protein